jgi:hypothetical protein
VLPVVVVVLAQPLLAAHDGALAEREEPTCFLEGKLRGEDMYQNFSEDVMDDFYDTAGAPAQTRHHAYDAYDDALDLSDDEIDEAVYRVVNASGGRFRVDRSRDLTGNRDAIRSAIRPGRPGVWVEGNKNDARSVAQAGGFTRTTRREVHGSGRQHIHGLRGQTRRSSHIFYGAVPQGEFADFDAFEDAMVDALEVEDTDEFFRRLARGIGRVARGIGRGIGRVARVIAPIASAIPLPWTQAIGRVASIAGRLRADGADEFEAIDALVDFAESEDLLDAAAPAIATLAVHGTMPQAARLPPATRQQLVRATTQTAQTIAQRQGTQAVRALPAVVQTAQRVARQQRVPPTALPRIIQQVGQRLSRNPQLIHRLVRSASPAVRQQICTACGRRHSRPAAR